MTFSKWAENLNKNLGYFWMKICCQEISKIAQSGHTYCCWAHSFLIQPRHDKLLSFDLKNWNSSCTRISLRMSFGMKVQNEISKYFLHTLQICFWLSFNNGPICFVERKIYYQIHKKEQYRQYNITVVFKTHRSAQKKQYWS